MKNPFSKIKARYVCRDNGWFLLNIGVGSYQLGIQLHPWGLRIMLIWWHVFVHWPEKTNPAKNLDNTTETIN